MIKYMIPLEILITTFLVPPLWAADGTLKFSGKLTENTCILDAGSKNQTIDIGYFPLNKNDMTGVNYAGRFTIKLSDCPANSNRALIRFEGTPAGSDQDPDKVFAFSNSDQARVAENVGFIIGNGSDSVDKLISVNGESKLFTLITGAGAVNELPFFLGYHKIKSLDPITAGMATGNMQFSVIYP